MKNSSTNSSTSNQGYLLSFLAVTIFFFFEAIQMSYLNVLAPYYLKYKIYDHDEISILSAAYFYGNMAGLLPIGFFLDRFSLRKIILIAIIGSSIGAFLLVLSSNIHFQSIARFICGFFGGTVSFVGGMKLIATTYKHRFTFFMGIFVSAAMLGGLVCQYPLLIATNTFGPSGAMTIVASLSIVVLGINIVFLKPPTHSDSTSSQNISEKVNLLKTFTKIIRNLGNWLDCLMIVFLDMPISVIGTLWGIVLFNDFYHFSTDVSSLVVMVLFAGIIVGSPLCGILSDKYNHSRWIVISGSFMCALIVFVMMCISSVNIILIMALSFGLGLFSSCQTLGFTWLLKNMNPKFIGINTAINSMIFMGANGLIKQVSGGLLTMPAIVSRQSSTINLFFLILLSMVFALLYVMFRKKIFINRY